MKTFDEWFDSVPGDEKRTLSLYEAWEAARDQPETEVAIPPILPPMHNITSITNAGEHQILVGGVDYLPYDSIMIGNGKISFCLNGAEVANIANHGATLESGNFLTIADLKGKLKVVISSP
jgi:hypothetical protein